MTRMKAGRKILRSAAGKPRKVDLTEEEFIQEVLSRQHARISERFELRKRRIALDLTQGDMARLMDSDQSLICRFERGFTVNLHDEYEAALNRFDRR